MRAVWLDVPAPFLEERRRLGHDRRDEVWDGELHMVPPASFQHNDLSYRITRALEPVAERRGLRVVTNETGLFDPAGGVSNYRIPDSLLVRPDQISERGVEGAELVIEVLSPHDESREKLPFFAARGVRELWLIEPATRALELYQLIAGGYRRVEADRGARSERAVRSPLLDIELSIVDGKLRLRDGDYVADV